MVTRASLHAAVLILAAASLPCSSYMLVAAISSWMQTVLRQACTSMHARLLLLANSIDTAPYFFSFSDEEEQTDY